MTGLAYKNGWSIDTPPFVPTAVPGLQLWLDAADDSTFTYSSGAIVSQWNDKSGNANHAAQATVADQPSRSGTINAKSSVVFANDLLAAITPASAWTFMHNGTLHTVFLVGIASTVGVSAFPAFLGTTPDFSTGPGMDVLVTKASTGIRHGVTAAGVDVGVVNNGSPVAAFTLDSARLVEIQADPANATAALRSSLGIAASTYTNNTNTAAPSAATAGNSLMIGGRSPTDVTTRLSGEIAEVLIYNRALTAPERMQVRNYLQNKWAV